MGFIERSPKFKAIVLTEAQMNEAAALLSERDDAYKRFTDARNKREALYQSIAGTGNDWELDQDSKILLVTRKVGS